MLVVPCLALANFLVLTVLTELMLCKETGVLQSIHCMGLFDLMQKDICPTLGKFEYCSSAVDRVLENLNPVLISTERLSYSNVSKMYTNPLFTQ